METAGIAVKEYLESLMKIERNVPLEEIYSPPSIVDLLSSFFLTGNFQPASMNTGVIPGFLLLT
ncbi:MAG: hypothetical protein M1526_05395 [Candidatus Thermoplasmatota archaeon]|jgi:hypothetical protein|nr:hypothetical protein [Candidatus Thermoplasmatota archaeon]MCL5681265.1 hypothetical protein [Candidatus Thermoplasmatota archaeon]